MISGLDEDLPECTIEISKYYSDDDGFTYSKISTAPDTYKEENINFARTALKPENLDIWDSCRKEHPEKIFYPFICHFHEGEIDCVKESFLQAREGLSHFRE